MGKQSAKEKQGARAEAQEKGTCIICGEARTGTPAVPEFPVRAARRIRSILRQPPRHTVACREHLEEARAKRAKFEKKVRDYLLGAALVSILIIFGSLAFGRVDAGLFPPALVGALFVAILPYFYYFPSFGK